MLSSAHCFSCPGLPWLKAGYFCSALYMLKLQYRVIGLCKLTKISLNVGAKHKSLVSIVGLPRLLHGATQLLRGIWLCSPKTWCTGRKAGPLLSCIGLVETLRRGHPCIQASNPIFQIGAGRNPIMRQRSALGFVISCILGIGVRKAEIISVMII